MEKSFNSPINKKLMAIQTELKAPKNLYNSFGKYKYRNAEGICEAVKPYLSKFGVSLTISDDIIAINDGIYTKANGIETSGRVYVKATATLTDCETNDSVSVSAFAREADDKKGMDSAQVTGATSSYARKYALNGLFLLDDTKDVDSEEYQSQAKQGAKKATSGPTQTPSVPTDNGLPWFME